VFDPTLNQMQERTDGGFSVSFVTAVPELVQSAAQNLAGIRSSLANAASSVAGPTTGIAAAAQDEVSVAIASMFGNFGQEFQALSAQAQTFHAQFVNLMNASAAAYAGAETANARAAHGDTPHPDVIAPRQHGNITIQNAETVFAASRQAMNSLSGGVSRAVGLLATNPAGFIANVQTAAQSVFLIGSPESMQNIASAVVNHTLGGITTSFAVDGEPTPVPNAHGEIYDGLVGTGDFTPPSGFEGQLVAGLTNFASSPFSGVLMGAVGPFVSPGVALGNSIGASLTDLTGGNPVAAFTDLLGTPANVVNGFFNGATLNLNPLAPIFSPFVSGGAEGGEQLTGMSLAFGGLFSPGQVVTGPGGPSYYGAGGSALNALGLDIAFVPPDDYAGGHVDIPAVPVGPIGAAAGLIDIVGQALGGALLG
jgi:PE family